MTVDIKVCENLAFFLPLWFSVKSILAYFRVSKTAVRTILNALNFDFWKPSHLKNVKSFQKFKIQACSNGQNSSFWGLKMTKVDFTYNLGSRKILNSTFLPIYLKLSWQHWKEKSHAIAPWFNINSLIFFSFVGLNSEYIT